MKNKDYFLVTTIKALIIPIFFVALITEKGSSSYIHLNGILSQVAFLLSLNVFIFIVSNSIKNKSMEGSEADHFLTEKIKNPISYWIQITFGFILYMVFLLLDIACVIIHGVSIIAILISPWKDIINFPEPNYYTEVFILLSMASVTSMFLLSKSTNNKIQAIKDKITEWANRQIASIRAKERGHKINYRKIDLAFKKWIPQFSYFLLIFSVILFQFILNVLILIYNKLHLYRFYAIPRLMLYALIFFVKYISTILLSVYLLVFKFFGIVVKISSVAVFSYFLYNSGGYWIQTYQTYFSIWVILKAFLISILGVFIWQLIVIFGYSFQAEEFQHPPE